MLVLKMEGLTHAYRALFASPKGRIKHDTSVFNRLYRLLRCYVSINKEMMLISFYLMESDFWSSSCFSGGQKNGNYKAITKELS